MYIIKNPDWVDARLLSGKTLDEIPRSVYEEINARLTVLRGGALAPLVSVVIPAYNEELSILRTLYSISQNITSFPTEIIVVNNNSTDRTQEVLDQLNVRSYFQPKQGWGPARQMGQEQASGKYILMADADCFYPKRWIQRMAAELMKEGVTCVYGGYSFLGYPGKPRWKFFVYEALRNVIAEIRHLNRPWINCVGMCMGYVRELGLKVGFVDRMIRGEDGRMCYELAQLGNIVRVRSKEVVVWTMPRAFQQDRSLLYSILDRALIEFSRFGSYFQKQPAHDTHTSANFSPPNLKYFKKGRQ